MPFSMQTGEGHGRPIKLPYACFKILTKQRVKLSGYRIRQQHGERLPNHLLAGIPEDFFGGGVGVQNRVLLVDVDDPVGSGL